MKPFHYFVYALMFLILPGVLTTRAQQVPVMVIVKEAVLDEFEQPLSNSDGDLVQFLLVNGQVYAPAVDGTPQAANPVIFTSRIGRGVAASPAQQGKFSSALTPPPSAPLVARVFNASTLTGASFYVDSAPFTPSGSAVLNLLLTATTNALDPADDDDDGLNNSWEKSLGSDRTSKDSDADGMTDGDEFRAGTGLADEDSFLAMVQVLPQGGHLQATWESVPGKAYQLQFRDGNLDDPAGSFSNVNDVVTASGDAAATTITNGAAYPVGFFRVRLVE
jgi:hypothetical protein